MSSPNCISCGCTGERACSFGCSWYVLDEPSGVGVCTTCRPAFDLLVVRMANDLRTGQLPRYEHPIPAVEFERIINHPLTDDVQRLAGELKWLEMNVRKLLSNVGTVAFCKGCNAPIYWVTHRKGAKTPYTQLGLNHQADCPERNRKKKTEPRPKFAGQRPDSKPESEA